MYTDAMENSIEVPRKTVNETTYDPAIPKQVWKKQKFKKIYAPSMFLTSLFIIAKIWTQPKYPSADE